MTTTGFDRVRPRVASSSGARLSSGGVAGTGSQGPFGHDAEGKRALFSSVVEPVVPGIASARIECSRCNEETLLGFTQAIRAVVPSLHFGLFIGHRDQMRFGFSLRRSAYPTFMFCPACHRPAWVRFTLQI